jgi:predicted extracellular nuclease
MLRIAAGCFIFAHLFANGSCMRPRFSAVLGCLVFGCLVFGALIGPNIALAQHALRIHDIQGRAPQSAFDGRQVQGVFGIVTATQRNGFYMQDAVPDTDPASSEGIFVYASGAARVSVGDALRVSGVVREFLPRNADIETDRSVTHIEATSIDVVAHAQALPAAVLLQQDRRIPQHVAPCENGETDSCALKFYPSLEGMRVAVQEAIVVSPSNRFGEATVLPLSANEALTPLRALRSAGDEAGRRIALDDRLQRLPQMNVGDRLSALVGVIDYRFGRYTLLPTQPPLYRQRAIETAVAPPADPTQLSVASYNVENLDPQDSAEKFALRGRHIAQHLRAPDIVGLLEVQDSSGPRDDGVVDAQRTLQKLIDAIIAAGGPRYQWRGIDPLDNQDGGEPGGNIRGVWLFNPARVAAVDRPGAQPLSATRPLQSSTRYSGVALSPSPGRIAPEDPAFTESRKPLAMEFNFRGESVFAILNHFVSHRGDDPLYGLHQPPRHKSRWQRTRQAQVVADFARKLLAIDPRAKLLVLGDLNDEADAPSLRALREAGLHSLAAGEEPTMNAYSYIYQGEAQALDQIWVSEALRSQAEYQVLHLNAAFAAAARASDHDPVLARLRW